MTDPKPPIDQDIMDTMSVAPPDPAASGEAGGETDVPEGGAAQPGVADEDPLSAHPS